MSVPFSSRQTARRSGSSRLPFSCRSVVMHDPVQSSRLTRRSLIAGIAALQIAYQFGNSQSGVFAAEADELIVREREPQNLESDFAALDSFITPNDRFYVRSHFAVLQLEAKSWQLKIEGAVKKLLELSYDELLK